MTPETRRIAIFFDGDNAQASLIENVLGETAKYGTVTTRRIYGDWTTPQMAGWKDSLHSFAFLGSRWQHSEAFGSAFDSRTYGHKQLSLLIKSCPQKFEMRELNRGVGPSQVYVKLKS